MLSKDRYSSGRIILTLADASLAPQTLAYFIENRDFLQPFEPLKPDGYFTLAHQTGMLAAERVLAENDTSYRYYISRAEAPGEIIGGANLNNVVRGAFHSCYVGYKLDHRYLRRGYATEAALLLTGIAFGDIGLHRLEGNIMPRNTASLKTAEKAGFVYEGLSKDYLLINGKWEDHVHMVRLNPNWKMPG